MDQTVIFQKHPQLVTGGIAEAYVHAGTRRIKNLKVKALTSLGYVNTVY